MSYISYKLLYFTVLISLIIIEKRCGLWVKGRGGGGWVSRRHPTTLSSYALVISVFYLIFVLLSVPLFFCGVECFTSWGVALSIARFRKSFASTITVQYACNEIQKLMECFIYPKVYQCILQTRTVPF